MREPKFGEEEFQRRFCMSPEVYEETQVRFLYDDSFFDEGEICITEKSLSTDKKAASGTQQLSRAMAASFSTSELPLPEPFVHVCWQMFVAADV